MHARAFSRRSPVLTCTRHTYVACTARYVSCTLPFMYGMCSRHCVYCTLRVLYVTLRVLYVTCTARYTSCTFRSIYAFVEWGVYRTIIGASDQASVASIASVTHSIDSRVSSLNRRRHFDRPLICDAPFLPLISSLNTP